MRELSVMFQAQDAEELNPAYCDHIMTYGGRHAKTKRGN